MVSSRKEEEGGKKEDDEDEEEETCSSKDPSFTRPSVLLLLLIVTLLLSPASQFPFLPAASPWYGSAAGKSILAFMVPLELPSLFVTLLSSRMCAPAARAEYRPRWTAASCCWLLILNSAAYLTPTFSTCAEQEASFLIRN